MSYGLRVWDASGNLAFDSTVAAGGVCLGFYTVAAGGSTFSFTDFQGGFGIALNVNVSVPALLYSTDNTLGYLRFVFSEFCAGGIYLLFAL